MSQDYQFMQVALTEAESAFAEGEVPVGAVVVLDDQVIATAHNQTVQKHDPSAHAEILALRAAGAAVENYRLLDTTLYVTLEPCLMCFSALVHARVKRVVFGAFDPKTGVCGSRFNAAELEFMNHHFELTGGVLAEVCGGLLQKFFQARR